MNPVENLTDEQLRSLSNRAEESEVKHLLRVSPEARDRMSAVILRYADAMAGGRALFRLDGSGGAWYSKGSRPEVGLESVVVSIPVRNTLQTARQCVSLALQDTAQRLARAELDRRQGIGYCDVCGRNGIQTPATHMVVWAGELFTDVKRVEHLCASCVEAGSPDNFAEVHEFSGPY